MGKPLNAAVFIPVIMLMCGCMGIPDGIEPVSDFELNRYLGTWYEIVRLDHPFERGLTCVTARYSMRSDGGVRVENRGYDPRNKQWKLAEGKAYVVGPSHVGQLKVSFWGPFYGAYNIIELDRENYSVAMVCGPNRSYFWILARQPVIPPALKARLIDTAATLGFDTGRFIQVPHENCPK